MPGGVVGGSWNGVGDVVGFADAIWFTGVVIAGRAMGVGVGLVVGGGAIRPDAVCVVVGIARCGDTVVGTGMIARDAAGWKQYCGTRAPVGNVTYPHTSREHCT
jgi:hypothetical protein